MGSLSLIVDSGAGLPKEWYEQHDILVAQHFLIFQNDEQRLDFNVSPEEFYSRLRAESEHPTTANPGLQGFALLYDAAFNSGADNVLVLTLMKEKSGAYNSAFMAAKGHPKSRNILVVDTHSVGPVQAFIALEVRRHVESHGLGGVEEKVELLASQSSTYFVPESLSFLASSGRVRQSADIANSQIRTTAVTSNRKVDAGMYEAILVSRHRTQQRALDAVLTYVDRDASKFRSSGFNTADLAVVHSGNPVYADDLAERINRLLPSFGFSVNNEYLGFMTPVLGRQFGPGAVGVAMLYRKGT